MQDQDSSPRYRCALITGASSGLGEEYARQLASSCDILVLVARRGDLLEKLAGELKVSSPATEVHCLIVDLTQESERNDLVQMCERMSLLPDLLVNNAGMGDWGEFSSAEWPKLDSMMQVNMTALTHLCHSFLPHMMAEEAGGAILNVSSLASTLPIPDFAVYAATKAYVSSFSEALRIELREFGIPVLAVCPGPVHTNFGKIAMRTEDANLPSREGFYVAASQVVTDSIAALHADRARIFPGWKVALLAAGISLLPMVLLRPLLASRRGEL